MIVKAYTRTLNCVVGSKLSTLECTMISTVSPKFTQQILIDILKRKSGCEDITIKEIKAGAESKKGDSYLSTIYKFTVKATGKVNDKEEELFLPIIAKAIPKNVARRKTFRSVDFFETEINFYENVWPLMKKLKDSSNLKEYDEVPLLLSSFCNGVDDYVALQDISFEGYGTFQRDKGVSQEYASLFLKLLANFHALSIAARDQNPDFERIAKSLKETYFAESFRKWYSGFQQDRLYDILRHAVKQELNPKYLEKINKLFASDFYSILCKLSCVHNKLSVVSQGDAWLPNFLIKVQDGKPINAVLIDFQLARYSTLTNDLVHFLYACISEDVLLNQWDDLIEEYHKYLAQRIYELGSDRNLITLDDLKRDIQENSLVGIAMSMESFVMSMLDDDEVADLDMLQGDEAVPLESVWDILPFQDDARNKKLAFLIKHTVDKGFIN